MPRRKIGVAAAVGVGAVAGVCSLLLLADAQHGATEAARLVPAYVVTKPVPRSIPGTAVAGGGYVTREDVPAALRPASAVTDLRQLDGKESATADAVGQVVVASMFTTPPGSARLTDFARFIPAGDVAVTVSLDPVHGVAHLPVPGDRVDILITDDNEEISLVQGVPIMAIGQATGGSTAADSNLYTFDVTPTQAIHIVFAQEQNDHLYLLLIRPGDTSVVAQSPIVGPDPFPAGGAASATTETGSSASTGSGGPVGTIPPPNFTFVGGQDELTP